MFLRESRESCINELLQKQNDEIEKFQAEKEILQIHLVDLKRPNLCLPKTLDEAEN